MGRLLEFILFIIIAYFIFKYLNRLFSYFPSKKKHSQSSANNSSSKKEQKKTLEEKNLNWDAETINYEELETKKDEKN